MMTAPVTGTGSQVRSLAKGLSIIELLAGESRSLPLNEIASRLGFSRSTAHQLLATLREHGFVDQEPESKAYRLGYRLISLVSGFMAEASISSLGIGPVQALRDATGDTCYLTILQGWELFIVFEAPGDQPIYTRRPKHSGQTHLHATASGKTLLAHLPAEQAEALLATVELMGMTPNTITSVDALQQELAAVRETGYALDREEFLTGVASIAAPVFDRRGDCVATVSVVYPAFRTERHDLLLPAVMDSARSVSLALGFLPQPPDAERAGSASGNADEMSVTWHNGKGVTSPLLT
jgi:DNA-binding IclR family transcriptional regulator